MAFEEFDGEIEGQFEEFTGDLEAPEKSLAESAGGWLKDAGASALQGVLGVAKTAALLGDKLTHNQGFENPAVKFLTEYGDAVDLQKSPELQAKEAARDKAISRAESDAAASYGDGVVGKAAQVGSGFVEGVKQTLTDPRLLASGLAQQVPMLGASAAGGKIIDKAVMSVASHAPLAAVTKAGTAVIRNAPVAGAVAAGGAMQGVDIASDTYSRVMGLPDDVWDQSHEFRLLAGQVGRQEAKRQIANREAESAGWKAAAVSVASNALPGGTAIEKALVGKGSAASGIKAVLGEAGQESIEEGGGQLLANQSVQAVDPNQSLLQGVGGAAGQGAALAGLMGGAAHIANRKQSVNRMIDDTAKEIEAAKGKKLADAGSVDAAIDAFNSATQDNRKEADALLRAAGVDTSIAKVDTDQMMRDLDALINGAPAESDPVEPPAPPDFRQRSADPVALSGAIPSPSSPMADVNRLVSDVQSRRQADEAETQAIIQMMADDAAKAKSLADASEDETLKGQADSLVEKSRTRMVDGLVASYAEQGGYFASRVLPMVDRQLQVLGHGELSDRERQKIESLLGSARAFIRPSLPQDPVAPIYYPDTADNTSMEALIPERRAKVAAQPRPPAAPPKTQSTALVDAPSTSQPLLSDDEAAMLGDFERMYQADVKADIRTRLGLAPKETQAISTQKMTPFKAFLRDAGVHSSLAADIVGTNAIEGNRKLPGAFRRNGMNLDMLVQRAKEQGFMSQADEDSGMDNGGVNKLVELIQQEFAGRPVQRLENATQGAADLAEENQRASLEQKADSLGIGTAARGMSSDRLNSLINRIERKLGKPVRTDFNGRKLMRSEARKEREAILFANKVENERLRYEAEIQAFAEADDRIQDAVLDVVTNADGSIEIVYTRAVEASEAADALNGQWSDQNAGLDTSRASASQENRIQTGAPDTRAAQEGIRNPEANRTEAGAGAQEAGLTDGITIHNGKGLIKGKFHVDVDGDGVPGGPWNTEQEARAAAEAYRQSKQVSAERSAQHQRQRDYVAGLFRDGKEVSNAQLEGIGFDPYTTDMRDFMSRAASLFGITSRQVRPIVRDLIKNRTSDMGVKTEYVNTRKALQAIADSQRDALTTYTPAEVIARQDAAAKADATAQRAEQSAAQAEAADKQSKEIAQRSVAAADTFELGQSAEDNLSGQGGLFSRAQSKEVRNLVTLHNLSEENLLHAGKMGGIPVPSIGITKVDSPFGGFGNITLIAPKGMIDPESGVPVYDRDAWTARFPTLNFKKVKARVADAFYERMKPAREMGDDGQQFLSMLWEEMRNASVQRPDKITSLFTRYDAARLFYSKEVLGKEIKVPMRAARLSSPAAEDKQLQAYWRKNGGRLVALDRELSGFDFGNSPEYRAFISEVEGAVRRYAIAHDKADKADSYVEMFLPNGNLGPGGFDRLRGDFEKIGTKEVDGSKLSEAVRKAVPDNDPAYLKWVSQQVEPLFEAPTITVRGREVPVTLDNIVDAMTVGATAGAEKSMTFSPGKVAAMLGKQFKSIDEIKAARDQVVSAKAESEGKKATDSLLDEYRQHVSQFYTNKDWRGNVDTWAANDDSMEALAKAGKMAATDGNIKLMLSRMGFKGVDQRGVDLARQSITALRNAATDYFEAKPQRAVKLNEFKGAVVPKGTSAEAIALLEQNGIDVELYGKTDGAREKAIQKLAKRIDKERGDVLFSKTPAPDFEAAMRLVAQSRRDTFNAVKSLADEISAKWKNAPEVVVVRSMQDDAVPESVRDSDAKQKSQGATGEPEGFFHKGKVYLVSSELRSRDDVIRVLFHEALGHYGLRSVFGDKLKQVLKQVAMMRRSDLKAKADEYGLDLSTESGRLTAAEEVLAEMAQDTPDVGFVRRAVGIIRGWARENIPGFSNLKMTDDEIVARFILPARRFVERGRGGVDGGAVMFSRAPAVQGARFKLDGETRFDEARRVIQDYFRPVLQVQQAILSQGGIVNETTDVYGAEERSHGRIDEAIKDFRDDTFNPLIEDAYKAGISPDELALYAYAMHAPERNAHIASINPRMPDGGSGMTNQEAADIIDAFKTEGKLPRLKRFHAQLMSITQANRLEMLDRELITQDEFNALDGMFQHYVPLRGMDEDVSRPIPAGRGFSVKGKETMQALGRVTRASDILENIVADYERSVSRGERNEIAQRFLKLVQDNPDPGVWEIDAVKTKQAWNNKTQSVALRTAIDTGPDTIAVKVKGKEVYIKVHHEGLLRAMQKAFKDETSSLERVLQTTMGGFNSVLRASLTQYNPVFGFVNWVRDFQMGSAGVIDELGGMGFAKFVKHQGQAVMAAHRYVWGTKPNLSNKYDRLFQEFRAAGATTGGFYAKDAEHIQGEIHNMLLALGAKPKTLKDKAKLLGGRRVMRGVQATARLLEYMGTVSENTTRFAAYVAAREMGKTPAQSASIAKNLTTNFNRKGEWGQAINSAYLFFNASVQGSVRVAQALKNQKIRGLMAGMTAAGVSLAMLAVAAGGDDDDGQAFWDKIPDFEKERNFIIMLPPGSEYEGAEVVGKDGRYIKIPMPYGFSVFPSFGYLIHDIARNKMDRNMGASNAQALARFASMFAGSFNPVGGSFDPTSPTGVSMALAPTMADVVIQQAFGRNAFDRPTAPYKGDFDTDPDSENVNPRQAGGIWHILARGLSKATGGDEAKAGAIDVAPGSIENAVKTLTGGTGTFFSDVFANFPTKVYDYFGRGEAEITSRDIPLLRNFYGAVDDVNDVSLLYERRRAIQAAKSTERSYSAKGLDPKMDDWEIAMASLSKESNRYSKELTKIRRQEIELELDEDIEREEKVARRKELRKERADIAEVFNSIFMDTMKDASDDEAKSK